MTLQLTIWHWLVIAMGGGIGAMARFASVNWINRLHGSQFPIGTFSVNVVGSFIMGLAFVLLTIKYPQVPGSLRNFVTVGLLGAFTTFSSFALESLTLFQHNHVTIAFLYMFASVFVCLIAVTLGYGFGKLIL
jgi:CrcB protein